MIICRFKARIELCLLIRLVAISNIYQMENTLILDQLRNKAAKNWKNDEKATLATWQGRRGK